MHPFQEHRQHTKERSRVSHIAGIHEESRVPHIAHRASGGRIHHEDAAEDKAMIHKEVKSSALKHHKAAGGAVTQRQDKPMRRASGGRTKHKGKGHTSVNVIVAPQGGHQSAPGPLPPPAAAPAPAPAPMPPRPPMGMPPGAGAPGGMPPPGGGPPGPGPRRDGGRTYARGGGVKSGNTWHEGIRSGTKVQHHDGKGDGENIGRGKPFSYAKGGGIKPANVDPPGRRTPSGVAGLSGGLARKTGGPIYASEKGQMGPKLPGGSGGERARKWKSERAKRTYAEA